MGGKEGAWGYLAQAVVCVVNSLVSEEWEYVQIEPDTLNDKVDIAWFYKEEAPKVVQVKTSKNNFTMPSIRKWIESLMDDYTDANCYELILIGTCNEDTKHILNRINEKSASDKDFGGSSILISNKEKIKVTQRLNDPEAFDALLYRNVGKFLSQKGKHAKDTDLELMSKALSYTYMQFSTQGKKESKVEFENRLIEWVNNFLGFRTERMSNIGLQFYLKDQIEFSNAMNSLRINLLNSGFFNKKKEDLISMINNINLFNVSGVTEAPDELNSLMFNDIVSLQYGEEKYCEFSETRRERLISRSLKILNIKLKPEFFQLGNLKEAIVKGKDLFGLKDRRNGTEEEIKKHEALLVFEKEMNICNSYYLFFNYLSSHRIIPLVLRNLGTLQDQDIKVKLIFEKQINVVNSKKFMIPDISIIKEFTGYDGSIQLLCSHQSDSRINPYDYRDLVEEHIYNLYHEPTTETLKNDFINYIDALFEFKHYSEKEKNVLVFNFEKLSPKENIAFPCLLMVKADEDFEINYEITSVNLSEVTKGKLLYNTSNL